MDYEVPYTFSRWSAQELSDHMVEFRLTYPKIVVEGVGRFIVKHNPNRDGSLSIEIDVTSVNWHTNEGIQRVHALNQQQVDLIEAHPQAGQGEPPKPQFRVFA